MYSQNFQPKILFRAQTKEEEFNRIISTIMHSRWFKKEGYRITFPQHKRLEEFLREAEKLANSDSTDKEFNFNLHQFLQRHNFKTIFFSEIYNPALYEKGLQEISKGKNKIEKALEKLTLLHTAWGFELKTQYQVLLTFYGTSGSYNPDSGIVLMKIGPNGSRGILPPATSIIHEIVHIGIEENIVKKFQLSQKEKEYVVDSICSLFLKELVTPYTFQYEMMTYDPPVALADFITESTVRDDLPLAISNFVQKFPR